MTLDEIDQLLDSWRDRLARVDENLLALEAEPTCQLLMGRDGRPVPLEGVTREQVLPALQMMHELFEQRARLNLVLERTRELRGTLHRLWVNEKVVAEIDQLLHGRSIKLPPVEIPLAQRGLLTEAERERAATPEELLQAMLEAFEKARDAVMTVDAAWGRLQSVLEATVREQQEIRELAEGLGQSVEGELAGLSAELEALKGHIARDPLGVAQALEQRISPRLHEARARLERLNAQRGAVQMALAQGRSLLATLREEHALARGAFDRSQSEIEAPPGLVSPLPEEQIEGLSHWLETLAGTVAQQKWQPAQVGLSRWMEAARDYLEKTQAARAANEGPLREREELLGRLQARQAQAQALLARGAALDPHLEASALQALSLLRSQPTPLGRAAELVAAYEAAVVALARR